VGRREDWGDLESSLTARQLSLVAKLEWTLQELAVMIFS